MKASEQKYLNLLKLMYDPKAGDQDLLAVRRAIGELTETEQVDFNDFSHKVGEVFLKVREELDEGLEELADAFPDETDPRKWNGPDWQMFHAAVEGHKYEELYTTYAKQEPNLHLMWKEIETRL